MKQDFGRLTGDYNLDAGLGILVGVVLRIDFGTSVTP